MSDRAAAAPRPSAGDRLLRLAEIGLWATAIVAALVFAAIKLRAWGPLDAPEQSDFAVFYTAARVSALAPQSLYKLEEWRQATGLDLHPAGPFLYPPTLAWLLQPLAALPYETARRLWFWASLVALAAAALLLWRRRGDRPWRLGVLLWLLLPGTLDTLHLGQLNTFLALLITLSFAGYADGQRRQARAGALVGLAGGVKLFPLSLLALGLPSAGRRFVVGGLAGLAAFAGAGLLALPLDLWQQFSRSLLGAAAALAPPSQETYILWNQSLLAFWRKLSYSGAIDLAARGESVRTLQAAPLAPQALTDALGAASLLTVVALTAAGLWRLYRRQGRLSAPAWGLLLAASLMVSPYTWWHYTVIVAPAFPIALAAGRGLPRLWRLALPLGFLLLVAQRGIVWWLPLVPLLPLSSLMLAGLLLIWAVLLRCEWRGEES